ncbi:HAD family hydrolase [Oceanitalea stevensii]|uniref:HAD family hydrolase n=1 Tax=Oceanitalea stevensii TaxID=2763072 RepID=A0ABR8Z630_9MICO|nr:HAD family hydrolase [Oceanitalea stevensii]MBD8063391.1 HAD family hydrolase [Oceanitalea stevensii]
MSPINFVVFDLDDTLTPEKTYVRSGFAAVADYLAPVVATSARDIADALMSFQAETPGRAFDRVLELLRVDHVTSKELVTLYREHTPQIDFYGDVMPTLSALREIGVRIGIVTDGYAVAQRSKLNALGASELVDEIIITDEYGPDFWKPDPRSFEMLARNAGSDVAHMAYVGDNPAKDFAVASTLPLTTVRVMRDGVHSHRAYLNDLREHIRISALTDIPHVLSLRPHSEGRKA